SATCSSPEVTSAIRQCAGTPAVDGPTSPVCCLLVGSRLEAFNLAGLAQHLVHFAQMHLFFSNHPARVFFQEDRAIANQFQQLLVKRQTFLLSCQRFEENIVNSVLL